MLELIPYLCLLITLSPLLLVYLMIGVYEFIERRCLNGKGKKN